MNKKEFIKKLNWYLRQLQRSERKKYIQDYEEIISELMENGWTEEEAVLKLGDVKQISLEILDGSKRRFGWIDWKGKGLMGISFLLVVIALGWWRASQGVVLLGSNGPSSVFLAGKIAGGGWIYSLSGIFLGVTVGYLFWKWQRWTKN